MQVKLGRHTFVLHDMHKQRKKLHESITIRRNVIAAAHAEQIARERNMIRSHLDRLIPGTRAVFLKARLDKLNVPRPSDSGD
jgi:hypothetical protein